MIGLCSPFVFLKILFSLNSLCWDIPRSSIVFTVLITSGSITSLVPSWINSVASSGRKGLPSCLNYVGTSETFLLNLALQLSESSWWWKAVWSVVSNTVYFSNSATALDIPRLQIVHRLNLSSTSLRPTIPSLPLTSLLNCSWIWSNPVEEKAFLVLDTTKFSLASNLSPCRSDEWTSTRHSLISGKCPW